MDYTKTSLKEIYSEKLPLFNRACINIKEALNIFLKDEDISFLTISSRVKDFKSFYEKIDRKSYENPFEENEDFCGIRVVLYYLKDVEKVNDIIKNEFNIQNDEDKADKLEVNEFGYRSHHFIIKIKDKWLVTPNYRGLGDIKIEIQVRTVLMHAWAEIEHKLGYKNKDQVPKSLKRKLFVISAKLEEADEQFQDLKININNYKDELIVKATKSGRFHSNEFDLNAFQALLDYYFPDHEKHSMMTNELFNQIKKEELSLEEVINYAEKIKPMSQVIDNMIFGEKSNLKTIQSNLLQYAIDAFYPKETQRKPSEGRKRIIKEIQKLSG
ncbi:MAG: hypothetical protein V4520_19385 [Bacteroidota bacterium]